MKKVSRQVTRMYAMHVLYQWMVTQGDLLAIMDRYQCKKRIDWDYFKRIVEGISVKKAELELAIQPYVQGRRVDEISTIEFAIVLIGSYELMFCHDVPYRVIINEAVTMSRQFGADDAHRFINSVLDELSKKVRKEERGT